MIGIDGNLQTTGLLGAEDNFYDSQEPPYRAANQQLSSISELQYLRSFTPEVIERLVPFVTALPVRSANDLTPINVNSASLELLNAMASQQNLSPNNFVAITEIRAIQPFESIEEFMDIYETNSPASLLRGIELLLSVKSTYFVSRSCAETGRVKLGQMSLLMKNRAKENVKVLYRQNNYNCPKLVPENIAEQQLEN